MNAPVPMEVTVEGSLTLKSAWQPLKAKLPMRVTFSGSVTSVTLLHIRKAIAETSVTG